jgi:hypothetical protein
MIFPSLIKGAGIGLSALGLFSGSRQRDEMGAVNQQISIGNAQQNRASTLMGLRLGDIGRSIELDASRTNLRLALADSEARNQNAKRLRQFAEAKTKQSREAIRRQMKTFDEFQSSQSAAVGASGTVMGGSAMEVLLASADQFRTSIADMADEANFERSNTLDSARMEEIGAQRDAAGARASFGYAQRGASLGRAASRIGRLNAQTAFQSAVLSAQADRLSAGDAAQGQRMGALSSLLTGAGSMLGDSYTENRLGMGNIPSVTVRSSNSSIFR